MSAFEDILVSVIVPVYKCEAFLPQCLDSILAQTHRNLEVLLVLDGETDGSPAICREFAGKDARVHVLQQPNSGVSVARNKGIEASSGKWLAFIDSDDWVDEDYIEVLLEAAEKSNCDIAICGYTIASQTHSRPCSFFRYNQHVFSDNEKDRLIINCLTSGEDAHEAGATNVGVPWSKLYRSSFIKEYGVSFPPGLKNKQDAIFNLYAFWYSSLTVLMPGTGYHYRRWKGGYRPGFHEVMAKMLDCVNTFIQDTGCRCLDEVFKYMTARLLREIVELEFLHEGCTLSKRQKLREIKRIAECGEYPFKAGLRKPGNASMPLKTRLLWAGFYLRQYTLVYEYCRIKHYR